MCNVRHSLLTHLFFVFSLKLTQLRSHSPSTYAFILFAIFLTHPLIHSFVFSLFVPSFTRSPFIYSLTRDTHLLTHSFFHSLTHLSTPCPFAYPCTQSLPRPFSQAVLHQVPTPLHGPSLTVSLQATKRQLSLVRQQNLQIIAVAVRTVTVFDVHSPVGAVVPTVIVVPLS